MNDKRIGEVIDTLLWLHRDLTRRRYPLADVPRQLAADLAAMRLATGSGCAKCGGPMPAPGFGRPRRYCLTCSPRKVPEKSAGREAGDNFTKETA